MSRAFSSDETIPFTGGIFSRGWLRRKAASERRRRRFRIQAKGLFHRFEAVALEAEEG